MELVFLLIAVALFAIAALGVGRLGPVATEPAGLFFLTLSLAWPHLLLR